MEEKPHKLLKGESYADHHIDAAKQKDGEYGEERGGTTNDPELVAKAWTHNFPNIGWRDLNKRSETGKQ